MREMRRDRRALSEIVGTLFLVLIVVAAATAFAAFVAGYQSQVQAQEAVAHDRSLESLKVLDVTPVRDTNLSAPNDWATLNFTVTSLDSNPTIIDSLSLNKNPVRNYTAIALNLTTGDYQTISVEALGDLTIGPREQFNIILSVIPNTAASSMYNPAPLSTTSYIQLDMFTAYSNDFSAVFVPPTPIVVINYLSTDSGTGIVNIPILDGSDSLQPGNSTLESWNWTITNLTNVVHPTWNVYGEQTEVTNFTVSDVYLIVLTVQDSDGLMGTTYPGLTFTYTG
jgi:flagellin-like protein